LFYCLFFNVFDDDRGAQNVLQIPAARTFRLSHGAISCDRDGLFVGVAPLLERGGLHGGDGLWRVRPIADLNEELSACYGLPADIAGKAAGLAGIARALDRGDLVLAQIASLGLQLPDPPALEKSDRTAKDVLAMAAQLFWSGLLKGDWDEAKHPRAGAPPNAGWFAPVPKEPKSPRSGWPQRVVNVALRELLPELAWSVAGALPIADAIITFLLNFTPTELNSGEDRITAQMRAYNYRPKTLEELQTPPTQDILGYEQHHIVEQNDDNIAKDGEEPAKRIEKFGRDAIDDPSNIVWIPRLTHEKITAEYNSKDDKDPLGRLKREVVNEMSFDEQRAVGLEALRRFGALK
jgi:A nuclease family of the HNH/ENDO VII superfamily with conserved AHH